MSLPLRKLDIKNKSMGKHTVNADFIEWKMAFRRIFSTSSQFGNQMDYGVMSKQIYGFFKFYCAFFPITS